MSRGTMYKVHKWLAVTVGAFTSLHTFEPLKLITKRDAVRKGLLVLLSMIGVGVAGTGYYLALPRRRPWVAPRDSFGR